MVSVDRITLLSFEKVERDGRKLFRGKEGNKMIKGGALFNTAWESEKYWLYCKEIGHNPFKFYGAY